MFVTLQYSSACSTALKVLYFVSLGMLYAIGIFADVPGVDGASFHSEPGSELYVYGGEASVTHAVSAPWYFCFEDKCRCRDDEADCSQNYGKLTFIPHLPEGIRFLNFSSNHLTTISQGNFFINVTAISSLDLSNNSLAFIHPHALKALTNLTCLLLRYNNGLTYLRLHPVFSVPTLQDLDVSGTNLGKLPRHFFLTYNFTMLRRLDMFGNHLMSGNLTAFAQLENLESLGLGLNEIVSVTCETAVGFHKVSLAENSISEFPNTCKNNLTLFPSLASLNLRSNLISSVPSLICLPELSYLDISQNIISAILTNSFSISHFPKLLTLDIGRMKMLVIRIEQDAFNNSGLETLSLANNQLDISDDDAVNPHTFRGCTNISVLVMSDNYFDQASESKLQLLFGVLPHLRELDLSSGSIANMPNCTFAKSTPLLRQISFRNNRIKVLPDDVMSMAENLTVLDLSKNFISHVQERAFSEVTRHRLRQLDLSGNMFWCTCELMWFRQWFVSQPSLFNHSHDKYTCTYVDLDDFGSGTVPLESFYVDKQACLFDDYLVWFAFILQVMVYLVSAIIVKLGLNVWRRRLLMRTFRGRENRIRFVANVNYMYDVFVAYADGDSEWIRLHLMPELEGRLGLKLCLHQRDFHPGRHILDNIEDSVEKSKKTMMIFSTHFAQSQCCQFELSLCQRHAMDNDDVMIVVCVEDVQPREWTSGMMAILRTSTYIRWAEENRANFWNIIAMALQDIIGPAHPQV